MSRLKIQLSDATCGVGCHSLPSADGSVGEPVLVASPVGAIGGVVEGDEGLSVGFGRVLFWFEGWGGCFRFPRIGVGAGGMWNPAMGWAFRWRGAAVWVEVSESGC